MRYYYEPIIWWCIVKMTWLDNMVCRCSSNCAGKGVGSSGQPSVPKGGVQRGEAAKRQEILNQVQIVE